MNKYKSLQTNLLLFLLTINFYPKSVFSAENLSLQTPVADARGNLWALALADPQNPDKDLPIYCKQKDSKLWQTIPGIGIKLTTHPEIDQVWMTQSKKLGDKVFARTNISDQLPIGNNWYPIGLDLQTQNIQTPVTDARGNQWALATADPGNPDKDLPIYCKQKDGKLWQTIPGIGIKLTTHPEIDQVWMTQSKKLGDKVFTRTNISDQLPIGNNWYPIGLDLQTQYIQTPVTDARGNQWALAAANPENPDQDLPIYCKQKDGKLWQTIPGIGIKLTTHPEIDQVWITQSKKLGDKVFTRTNISDQLPIGNNWYPIGLDLQTQNIQTPVADARGNLWALAAANPENPDQDLPIYCKQKDGKLWQTIPGIGIKLTTHPEIDQVWITQSKKLGDKVFTRTNISDQLPIGNNWYFIGLAGTVEKSITPQPSPTTKTEPGPILPAEETPKTQTKIQPQTTEQPAQRINDRRAAATTKTEAPHESFKKIQRPETPTSRTLQSPEATIERAPQKNIAPDVGTGSVKSSRKRATAKGVRAATGMGLSNESVLRSDPTTTSEPTAKTQTQSRERESTTTTQRPQRTRIR
ncbi:MAG: hypothetical protein H6679_03945 [Epsilonproteobacteria bacterium]|nr:hypothetical protein [Campylobacterota bacterium]